MSYYIKNFRKIDFYSNKNIITFNYSYNTALMLFLCIYLFTCINNFNVLVTLC